MAKGISINFGLNAVDPKHYEGWDGKLNACEFDANDMALVAASQKFQVKKFLTKDATRKNIMGAVSAAAEELVAGDMCLITYSGHGGQVPDTNKDEDDGLDETWCLYDGEMIDDEVYALLARFKKGVRILVLADCCHSGTTIKAALLERHMSRSAGGGDLSAIAGLSPVLAYRAMPMEIASRVYLAHQAFYDKLQKNKALKTAKDDIAASAILISGCQDNQLSGDGAFNGVFTGRLKAVWNGGKFKGDYVSFWKKIKSRMPPDQTPNLYALGAEVRNFEKLAPFKI